MPLIIPDQNIAMGGKVPDGMNTLGSMMNVANGANQLQLGQQLIQSNDMKLQAQTQGNQERLALQDFMSKPDNWQTDGQIDMAKLNATVPKIAPMTGGDVLSHMGTLSKTQTDANTAKVNMTTGQRSLFAVPMSILGRAGITDPSVYSKEIDGIAAQYPNDPNIQKLAGAYKTNLSLSPAGPQIPHIAIRAADGLMGPSESQSALSPKVGLTDTGGALTPTITQPSVNGNAPTISKAGGETIGKTLAPGAQESVITDSQGRIAKVTRSPQGAITGAAPVAGVGNGSAPAPLQNVPNNESQSSMDALNTQYQEAQGQALKAANMHSLNQEIYRLSDTSVSTGKFGSLFKSASNFTNYKMAAGDAENYNTLGKMLAQNNAQLAASMGPHTNAGLAQTNEANGTLEYDKNTLKTIATRNDALVTGTELYAQGLKRAIDKNGLQGKHQFDAQWGAAFDVDAMALKNAVDNGNKGQTQMIIKKLGGPNSDGAKALFKKLTAIDALAGQ